MLCRTLIVVVALMLPGPASAFHALPGDPHWPTTTVQQNGGQCTQNPECRWIKIIDRTGYGSWWTQTVLPNALVSLSLATGGRFQFTIVRGPRFNLWVTTEPQPCQGPCEGYYRVDEAAALTPPGAVFVPYASYGQDTFMCDDPAVDPDGLPPFTGPQPYCGAVPASFGHHIVKAVGGAGMEQSEAGYIFKHEMGHTLGLDHRALGERSIMVGDGVYNVFDSHDKAELARLYSHSP